MITLLVGACGVQPQTQEPSAVQSALSLSGVAGTGSVGLAQSSSPTAGVVAGMSAALTPVAGAGRPLVVAVPPSGSGPALGVAPSVPDRLLIRQRNLIVVDGPAPKNGQCRDLRHQEATPFGTWTGTVVVQQIVSTVNALNGKAYCRYTWKPDPGFEQNLSPIDQFVAFDRIFQVDKALVAMHAVAPAASPPIPEAVWTPLQNNFRKQAGYLASLPKSSLRASVRVAVLDTAIHGYADQTPDNSAHGRTVGRIIDSLACPTPDRCPQIVNYLALPEVSPGRGYDPAHGGFFGTRGQVAEALQTTLDDWTAIAPADRPRLIINMSFGWAEERDGNPAIVEGRTLTADVVRQQLRRASCLGALLVAAAGNGGQPDQIGPLYPAAWETDPAPDASACTRILSAAPDPDAAGFSASYRPLVYAVGAVDYRDTPLVITRPGSLPRLVAHGLSIAVEDQQRVPGYAGPFTGTSMAAAQVSGIAAAVWGNLPDLSPHHLIEQIHDSGVPLTAVPVEHCLDPLCISAPARRVSLCELHRRLFGSGDCATVRAGAGVAADLPLTPLLAKLDPCRSRSPLLGACVAVPPPVLPAARTTSDEPAVIPQPVPTCSVCLYHRASDRITGYVQDPPPGFSKANIVTSGGLLIQGVGLSFNRSLAGGPTQPIAASLAYETTLGASSWGGDGALDVADD